MLNIQKTVENNEASFTLEGELDTITAPELEKALQQTLPGLTKLTLDFTGLDYISSAGLRVLLTAQKIMNKQGGMLVRNVNKDILEVFEITGFSDVLTIE